MNSNVSSVCNFKGRGSGTSVDSNLPAENQLHAVTVVVDCHQTRDVFD